MTDDIGHTSDADRVEEIREGLTLKYERMRDGGRLRVVRGDISLADARFLLAQYDALREAAIRTLQLYQLYDVAKLAGQDISKECVGFLIEAASEACRVLGKPWGFWREGGEDDGEAPV